MNEKKNKKNNLPLIIVLIFAAILIVVVSVAAYLRLTAGTYKNENLKFSFSIPSGWKIATQKIKEEMDVPDAEALLIKEDAKKTIVVNVEGGAPEEKKVTEDYLMIEAEGTSKVFSSFIREFKVVKALPLESRNDGIEVIFTGLDNNNETIKINVISIYHNKSKYVFFLKSYPEDFEKDNISFLKIINSLRFLD